MGAEGRWAARLDAAFFVLAGMASVWFAYLTLAEGVTPGWQALLVIVFWVLVAYLVLPRLHRILTRIYVPDYFIGRTRTADGLLGDPINLAVMGSADQVHAALQRGGWTRADELTARTGWRIVTTTLSRRSYPQAPVSPLFLFGRRQDFAYQQEVDGNPSQRHHVRFWSCPDGWLLPGGFAVDWLAAGTYDRSVGLSLFTLQITHKIDQDTDVEREHIIDTVRAASAEVDLRILRDFSTGYHSRNGGGDLIRTDGDLPVLDVNGVGVEAGIVADAAPSRSRRGRPAQVVFGAVATVVQTLVYFGFSGAILLGQAGAEESEELRVGLTVVGALLLLVGLGNLVLAAATLAARNWARLALCALSLLSIATTYFERTTQNQHGPLHGELLPLGASVLVLLALSSSAARQFTTTRRSEPDRPAGSS